MKKLTLGLMAAAIALGVQAQTVQTDLSRNIYKGKIGLSNVRNISDAQLQQVGRHISSLQMPTKAQTKQMIKAAMAERNAAKAKASYQGITDRLAAANYTPADTLFSESWEEWDSRTFGWVPAAWTRFENFDKSTYISEADGSCPTWMVYETDGYYSPYATDGRFVMLCMYGEEIMSADSTTVIAPAPQQDEWLVSPVVSNVQASNFLSFDLAFSPLYSHFFIEDGQNVLDMNRLAYDVEVLVTTSTRSASNNEENYTKLFRLSDIVDELINSLDPEDESTMPKLMNMRWQHFKLPLKEFEGKNIRIAFRYKGQKGGAVLMDAVRVSDMLPVALFDRPEGSFFMGFSDDARLSYSKNVLMPAYVPTIWKNYSNQDAESYVWSYNVNGASGQSKDYDLTLPAVSPGQISWPTLQANAAFRADQFNGGQDIVVSGNIMHSDFGTAKVGGDARISYDDGLTVNFGLGNFDPTKLYWLGEISNSGGIYAFGSGSGQFWAEQTNYQYNAVSGIANVYDAPASPYIFNSVTMPLGNFFNMGANIVCTVYKAKDLGNDAIEVTPEVLGQAMASEGTPVGGGYIMSFNFPNVMVIDSPIAIEVSGFDNQNLLDIAPLTQALSHDSNRGYAFVLLKNQQSGGVWWCEIASALSDVEGNGNMEVSHCLGMNAVFPYLHSNDGDVFEALNEGGKKSFDIDSYWYPKKQNDADQLNGWTIECSDSWIKVEQTIDDAAMKAGIDITAEALPTDVEGRVATVIIKGLGCQEVITVKQGNTAGINGITLDGFTTACGTYSIAGQRVNRNNAKGGIFIENRGGKFVKVVK